jgi:hypothetical protein
MAIGAVAVSAFVGYVLYFGRRGVAAGLTGDIAEAADAVPVA